MAEEGPRWGSAPEGDREGGADVEGARDKAGVVVAVVGTACELGLGVKSGTDVSVEVE